MQVDVIWAIASSGHILRACGCRKHCQLRPPSPPAARVPPSLPVRRPEQNAWLCLSVLAPAVGHPCRTETLRALTPARASTDKRTGTLRHVCTRLMTCFSSRAWPLLGPIAPTIALRGGTHQAAPTLLTHIIAPAHGCFRVTPSGTTEVLAERARLSVRGLSELERGVNSTPAPAWRLATTAPCGPAAPPGRRTARAPGPTSMASPVTPAAPAWSSCRKAAVPSRPAVTAAPVGSRVRPPGTDCCTGRWRFAIRAALSTRCWWSAGRRGAMCYTRTMGARSTPSTASTFWAGVSGGLMCILLATTCTCSDHTSRASRRSCAQSCKIRQPVPAGEPVPSIPWCG